MSMMERGDIAIAMGFNQNKTAHDFRSTITGGEIMITALDANDTETVKQIKNHVVNIQKDFTKGNFSKPFFIHAETIVFSPRYFEMALYTNMGIQARNVN